MWSGGDLYMLQVGGGVLDTGYRDWAPGTVAIEAWRERRVVLVYLV